ncbi:hypothetical protein PBAL39_12865 [Pedobacter sp. BAL39]|uniref:hypothetical protein n=1 Tax=Pedobacter sp. BAL39 TaxID=391596 RepID=UPI0001559241|nr:hypothetical protein [Pedobacter sp. BAL39]EDM35361.1 hypothetical protein PBAL39_12865 [Pedobacter sp. BAL39]
MSLNRRSVNTASNAKKKHTWKYVLLFLFILVALHNVLGALSYNAFVILDNIFSSFGAGSPVFMWSLVGSFLGIILGSVVASRKFKLGKIVNLLSCLPVVVLIFSLLLGTGPFTQITPRPDVYAEKSTADTVDAPAIVSKVRLPVQRRKKLKAVDAKVKREDIPARLACEERTAVVSVTVRSDSLRFFYRTAKVKGGEWSDWESIFIPQPGQYALSGPQGKVKANSIQYYYEAKLEATRSAADPFSRSLCTGVLSIDTY